ALFKIVQPKLYSHFERILFKVLEQDHTLHPPFETVFAEVTFDWAGSTTHVFKGVATNHYAGGWCAILTLGRYDHKRRGQIVFWDLNVVVELPPRSVIFIPSGIVRYSILAVAPHEQRCTMTLHSGGGLFLWAGCGYRAFPAFSAAGQQFAHTGLDRWKDALSLFS
ncbi:hypothetical protein K466DRAFT_456696, partial [Polyporus arcularius HHB13444]